MDYKIALIYPKTKEVEFEAAEVPYSVFFPASFLQDKGINAKIFDQRITPLDEILRFIKKEGIPYVGISSMTGPQLKYAVEASKKVKNIGTVKHVIWGGVHPTIEPESVIRQDYADFVVRGDGEETLYELLTALERNGSLADIAGLTYKAGGNVKHNPDRPFLDLNRVSLKWELIDVGKYISLEPSGKRSIAFITSRGCYHRCVYCWNTVFNKRTWRSWNIENTKKEMEKLKSFGVTALNLFDDNIGSNKDYAFAVHDIINRMGFSWFASLRVDFLKDDNIKRFRNCAGLYLGAESGSEEMLKLLNKDITPQDIINSAEALKKYSIEGNYSWMVGFPGESDKDVEKTLDMVDRVHSILPGAAQRIRIYNPYPGSQLYGKALKEGFVPPEKLEDWSYFSREYCTLDYVKHPWRLKCMSYVTYFYFYVDKRRKTKPVYRMAINILSFFSRLRWKNKFFSFPVEFYAIEKIREMLKLSGSKYGH